MTRATFRKAVRAAWPILIAAPCLLALAAAAQGLEDNQLRVCADPDDLPSSNEKSQGFENKIAEIVAHEMGAELEYYWWPYQRGLVRNTLKLDKCDVLISIPKGYDPVTWTKAYYRSAYVLVYRSDRKLDLQSLDDTALRNLKIGAHVNTPPFDALGARDLGANIVNYRMFYDPRDPDPSRRPQKLLEDLASGAFDVALAWGPLAGFFAKQNPSPALTIVPLADDPKLPETYEFSMGVQKGNKELKARLEAVLDARQGDIRKILEDYGVPLLPLKPPGPAVTEKDMPAGSHKHDDNND